MHCPEKYAQVIVIFSCCGKNKQPHELIVFIFFKLQVVI